MAIVWTPTRTEGTFQYRLGMSLEVESQSGNSSVVRWAVLIQRITSIFPTGLAWRSSRHNGAGVYPWAGTAGLDMCVVREGTVTLAHNEDGTRSAYSAWVATAVNSGTSSSPQLGAEVSGSRRTVSLSIPTINRLPNAPGIPTVSVDLRDLVVEAGIASTNGAAPVLEYQLQMRVEGGDWSTIQTGARKATLNTLSLGVLGKALEFRARARSVTGWGSWSTERSLTVPRLLGVRHTEGDDVTCQIAERYLGDGVWTPCTAVERFDGAAWVAPS
ncbi:hypothetical protein [Leucobacter sp.]